MNSSARGLTIVHILTPSNENTKMRFRTSSEACLSGWFGSGGQAGEDPGGAY